MRSDEVVFVTLVDSLAGKANAKLLINSLRRFGGNLRGAPFRVFELDSRVTACGDLVGEAVSVIPLAVAKELRGYPFCGVVEACAQVEQMEVGEGGTVAWIDSSCLVIQPPKLLRLGEDADAAVRPVHLRNVGLRVGDDPDGYWRGIYRAVGVGEIDGCVESFVDGEVLKPYFNSHCFSFNPRMGLMRQWRERYEALVGNEKFQKETCQDGLHQTFLFQAVLSALLANRILRNRLRLLPPTYNYPLHLHGRVPGERQAQFVNELVIATNEGVRITEGSIPGIKICEPLAAWLEGNTQCGTTEEHLNNRQRFLAAMHYQPVDRSPLVDFGFWDETIIIWRKQGLPSLVKNYRPQTWVNYFGVDFSLRKEHTRVKVKWGLSPEFKKIVVEERGEEEIFQQADGVQVLRQKFMRSIPKPQRYLLHDRESWKKHYLPRLNPDRMERYPKDWAEQEKKWRDKERKEPVFLSGGSLYGVLRNWMGLENLSMVVYDDPAWFEEMVATLGDLYTGQLRRFLETGGQFDACHMWEDMCYNAGPLLSPRHFKKYLSPQYRRITDLLHQYGVDIVYLDCDGNIEALMPLWLDAGVNCMFPVEIGTWGADPIKYRKQYGKDLLLIGGFDKHILAGDKRGIEKEVYRLLPLVEEGGFIGCCDHLVPPDVPYENYLFYMKMVRKVWGRNINLPDAQR